MRNALKAVLAASLLISPVSGAMAARPTASVPTVSGLPPAKARPIWANPMFFVPLGIAVAIIVVAAVHNDKNEPPPVSRG